MQFVVISHLMADCLPFVFEEELMKLKLKVFCMKSLYFCLQLLIRCQIKFFHAGYMDVIHFFLLKASSVVFTPV